MTFKKYQELYPEQCFGCRTIFVDYNIKKIGSFSNIDVKRNGCATLSVLVNKKVPLDSYPCPCMTCLIKMKCTQGCNELRGVWSSMNSWYGGRL